MKKYHIFKLKVMTLNIISIVLLVVFFVITGLLFPEIMYQMGLLFDNYKNCLLFLPLMLFYFGFHEILHAIGYVIHGANKEKITFGAELEKGVFYCLCKDEINKKNVLFSLMYPLFFIGIVTYIISIIFNYPLLLLLSIMNICGSAGDIMYFIFIVKLDRNVLFSEMDDGTSFALISSDDPSKYKHYGLEYCGTSSSISRKDFTRIKISKVSLVVLIFCLICLIIGIFI